MILNEVEKKNLEDLISSLNPNQFRGLTTKVKSLYPDIYKKLKDYSIKLNLKNVSEVIYLVINDMENPPVCEGISKECTHTLTFKTINEGYTKYCKKCSSLSEDFIQKRMETNIDKYGTEFPNKNEEIRKKISESKKTVKKYVPNVPLIDKISGYKLKNKRSNRIVFNFSVHG